MTDQQAKKLSVVLPLRSAQALNEVINDRLMNGRFGSPQDVYAFFNHLIEIGVLQGWARRYSPLGLWTGYELSIKNRAEKIIVEIS